MAVTDPVSFIKGKQVLIDGQLKEATIEIKNGKIFAIHPYTFPSEGFTGKVIDAGSKIVMAGLVDSHVHVNEPGRTEWEGYWTATRAAAAGGVTTIIDMPLNSIPPTTTVDNLDVKIEATKGKCHVDVGFWGGVVPENLMKGELKALVKRGVIGFKCFLIHSGVDEFPCVNEKEVEQALKELQGTGSLLAFHAEVDVDVPPEVASENPEAYSAFLNSRPSRMESKAIEMVIRLCRQQKDVRCHIVHLSASEAIPLIAETKKEGFPLTVETCPHYLTLTSDDIGTCQTQFKCCPPIRSLANQDSLWEGLRQGVIDLVVSDHSPCTPELKKPDELDFMKAWGGISSLQFGLPLIWTNAFKRGFKISDVARWMCQAPAELSHLGNRKGRIQLGNDADFVIWDPQEEINVTENSIHHKNKVTPYKGKSLKGKVLYTILRGTTIFEHGKFFEDQQPIGQLLIPSSN